MDIRKFNYLFMVAQEGSLSKAAEKLYLSPSALSQYITKEEQSLGTQLFIRTRDNWTLTYAGEIYVETAKLILTLNNNMEQQIHDIAENRTGEYNIGLTLGLGIKCFSAVYPKFNKVYPDIHIHIIEARWNRLQRLVMENTLDLCISGVISPIQELPSTFDSEMIAEFDLILCMPKTHHLAYLHNSSDGMLPEIDLSLLANESFVSFSKETSMRKTCNDLFEMVGINPNVLFECSSIITVLELVKQGFGLGILPHYYARTDSSDNILYFRLRPNMNGAAFVVWRKGYYLTNAMQYFVRLAKEYFRELNE